MQSRHWCFTLNNYTAEDVASLDALGTSDEVSYVVYGKEVGANGTPHLQGYIIFARKKRMREASRYFIANPHLEAKRGTPEQAAQYCKKGGDFTEHGELPRSPGVGGQLAGFVEWVVSYFNDNGHTPNDRAICRAFPHLYVRYARRLRELAEHHAPNPVLEEGELRPWQHDLADVLNGVPPDDRSILFYVDQDGGKGKSWFQRYMLSQYPDTVQVLSAGKRDDVAHAIDSSKRIFMFNIPRGAMEFFNYNIIEMLKDRMIFSPKYDSMTKILRHNPHVIVFSNEQPDTSKMTEDRYVFPEF